MRQEALYLLHASTGQEFEQTGERARLEQFIARVCPDMTGAARRRISRQIARGLDAFGREAINLGIEDLFAFESRLRNTPVQMMGFPASLKQTLQNAVRYLHVAAREGSAADLEGVLHIKRRRRNVYVEAEPLPMTSAGTGATGSMAASQHGESVQRSAKEQNKKPGGRGQGGEAPAAPTLADVDGVVERLAVLQRKMGVRDANTVREVIGLLVGAFSDTAVLQLVAALPDGYRQPVTEPTDVPERPSVSAVARRVLTDSLVSRFTRLPQT